VRYSVTSLLALTLTSGDGQSFVLEAVMGSNCNSILDLLNSALEREKRSGNLDNKQLVENLIAYLTSAAVIGLQQQMAELTA